MREGIAHAPDDDEFKGRGSGIEGFFAFLGSVAFGDEFVGQLEGCRVVNRRAAEDTECGFATSPRKGTARRAEVRVWKRLMWMSSCGVSRMRKMRQSM